MGMDCYMTVKANGKAIEPPEGWNGEWVDSQGFHRKWIPRYYRDFAILTGGWECRDIYIDEWICDKMVWLPNFRYEDAWGYRLTLEDFRKYNWNTIVEDLRKPQQETVTAKESKVYKLWCYLESLGTEDILVEFTIQ